jgi:hypothetical protein
MDGVVHQDVDRIQAELMVEQFNQPIIRTSVSRPGMIALTRRHDDGRIKHYLVNVNNNTQRVVMGAQEFESLDQLARQFNVRRPAPGQSSK